MAKICIIVPVYNVEKYLNRCIDSILAQTFADFELVLVDDGSPDNCGKICDEYAKKDSRVVVIHKQNGGPSDARNKGIDWAFENSDSQWLTFIDSDDWVHGRYLEILFDAVSKHNVKISSCGYMEVKDRNIKDEKIRNFTVDIDTPDNMMKKGYKYYECNFILAWGRLYEKDLFKDIRYPFGRLHEDMFVIHKLIYKCNRIANIKDVLYYYFKNDAGIMASEVSPKRMEDRLDSHKDAVEFFYKNSYMVSFKQSFADYCYMIRKYNIDFGQKKAYKKILKSHMKYIKKNLNSYYAYLPERSKKYGFKNWIIGQDVRIMKLENFRNDILKLRKERGFIFSILWAIKNYWN